MLLRDLNQQMTDKQNGSYESLTIAAYASGMTLGDRQSGLICPYCHGGGSKERSLSIAVYESGAQWRCWRNSCGKKGRLNLNTGMFHDGAPTDDLDRTNGTGMMKQPQPNYISNLYNNLCQMKPEWKKYFQDTLGMIPDKLIGLGWLSTNFGHLVIPLKSCNGCVVGHEFRLMEGVPKSRLNLLSTKSFVRSAYNCPKKSDFVLIVEDAMSAAKASAVCRTYALHGTNFCQQHIEELSSEWGGSKFLLALDKDATMKAADYVKTYRFQLPGLTLCPLSKDLKHEYVADIEKLVESYK